MLACNCLNHTVDDSDLGMNSEFENMPERNRRYQRIIRFTEKICGVEKRVAALFAFSKGCKHVSPVSLFGRIEQTAVGELGQLGRGCVALCECDELRVLSAINQRPVSESSPQSHRLS